MKASFLVGACVLGLIAAAPAYAQHQGHAGHTMPPAKKPAATPAPPAPQPAPQQHDMHDMTGMEGMQMPAPAEPAAAPATAQPMDHSGHDMPPAEAKPDTAAHPEPMDHSGHVMSGRNSAAAAGQPMDHTGMAGMGHEMRGALGPYSMTREASGTAWQPDSSIHSGLEAMVGKWMLMGHGVLNGVYDWQEGPRGGEKAFASGMLMGIARRDFTNGNALQFKAMLSPDPLMGKRGYPLHLASGETANGVDPLIDRQHPHDLFMELSASYSVKLGEKASVFLYGGLPGEPAFGPPAFMHRMSIMDSPEAPISHHWLDSTHITFGVVTAGLVLDRFKIEASRFHGREPDENRYDIETGPLDSTAVRVSFNPTSELSLQASWAHLKSPEQLEPDQNQTRWSASGIYTKRLGEKSWWSTTLAWGRRSSEHESFDAVALESAVALNDWTLFGRAEYTENNELLFVGGHHGPTFNVGKVSVGAIRDFRVAEHVKFGVGALIAANFVPRQLEALYGGEPKGAMAFVRFKID